METQRTPWECRGELGSFKAWWTTWKGVVLSPHRFWRSVAPDGSTSDALSFAWFASVLGSIISAPMVLLNIFAQSEQFERSLGPLNLAPETQELLRRWLDENAYAYIGLAGFLVFPLASIVISGVLHLSCLLFGASKNGFIATVRVVGYSYAPLALVGLPYVGTLAVLYMMVEAAFGMARLKQIGAGRAAAVVFVPGLVALCGTCAGLGMHIGFDLHR